MREEMEGMRGEMRVVKERCAALEACLEETEAR